MTVTTIQNESGDVWVMLGDRVLMYVDRNGTTMFPGDVVACAKIPPPPRGNEA